MCNNVTHCVTNDQGLTGSQGSENPERWLSELSRNCWTIVGTVGPLSDHCRTIVGPLSDHCRTEPSVPSHGAERAIAPSRVCHRTEPSIPSHTAERAIAQSRVCHRTESRVCHRAEPSVPSHGTDVGQWKTVLEHVTARITVGLLSDYTQTLRA